MIHQVTLYQTLPHVDETRLDQMMIASRVALVKIPEISGVRTGKNVEPGVPWAFLVALEVDNLERLKAVQSDAGYIKFLAEVISPNVSEQFVARYELEPGRSVKLS